MIHMAMVKDVMYGKTMRKSYAKYEEILEIPNMLKIQKDSYQWFLETGLREVFKDVGTITDFSGKLELSFLDYTMEDKPKYTIEECKERDATYAKPIKVRVRLRNTETDEIKEQEIFMGDFPVMTNGGTFVINGAERVIISQIVRSPGMYYGHEVDKADLEFPNDLLWELDKMEFYIPETKETVKAKQRPIVIITSNAEKELPDAFLRRCIFHYIAFPTQEQMEKIIRVHFDKLDETLLAQAMQAFYWLRSIDSIEKKPSTSELVDWLRALELGGVDPARIAKDIPFAGVLLKKDKDITAMQRRMR